MAAKLSPGSNAPLLSAREIAELKPRVPSWEVMGGKQLSRTFLCPDFASALGLANRIGAVAEELDHHPELSISWGKLNVIVWTHRVNGLTELDFMFAARCDAASSAGAQAPPSR